MASRNPTEIYDEAETWGLHLSGSYADVLAFELLCVARSKAKWDQVVIPRAVQAVKIAFVAYYESLWCGVNHWSRTLARVSAEKYPGLALNQPFSGVTDSDIKVQIALSQRP